MRTPINDVDVLSGMHGSVVFGHIFSGCVSILTIAETTVHVCIHPIVCFLSDHPAHILSYPIQGHRLEEAEINVIAQWVARSFFHTRALPCVQEALVGVSDQRERVAFAWGNCNGRRGSMIISSQ